MRTATLLLASLAAATSVGGLLAGVAGCLRSTSFACDTDTQCGAGGTCEATSFCSFPDAACASGARYGTSAGTYANQCVEGGGAIDGGVDADPTIDGAIDAPIDAPPQAGCPVGYATITGGEGTHTYRVLTASANWTQNKDACAATSGSAYLAIPNDATELAAIVTASAATRLWIGVTDSATEDTWLDVKGAVQTFLPWAANQPDDANPGEDCVSADSSEFRDDKCNVQFRAVCECEP